MFLSAALMIKKELKRVVTADKTVKAAAFKSSRSRRREGERHWCWESGDETQEEFEVVGLDLVVPLSLLLCFSSLFLCACRGCCYDHEGTEEGGQLPTRRRRPQVSSRSRRREGGRERRDG